MPEPKATTAGASRGRPDGTVRQQKNGRWQAMLPNRFGRRSVGTFDSETAAWAALRAAVRSAERGELRAQAAARAPRTFTDAWLARRASLGQHGASTVRDYDSLWRTHLEPVWGQVRVNRATPDAVAAWEQRMATAGVGASRQRKARMLLGQLAAAEGNPLPAPPRASGLKAHRAARQATVRPLVFPTWRELAALTSHPSQWEDRLLLALLAWGGLRWSEAASLAPGAVQVTAGAASVSVERVYMWHKREPAADEAARMAPTEGDLPVVKDGVLTGWWRLEAPKGGHSGAIPLPRPLGVALHDLADSRSGDFLFPSRTSLRLGLDPMPMHNAVFSAAVWRPARDAAGLGPNPLLPSTDGRYRGAKIHHLRAMAASVVVDAGGSLLDASRMLRHLSPGVTEKHYLAAAEAAQHDPDRAALRADLTLPLAERIGALWEAWAQKYPAEARRVLTSA